MRFFKKFGFVLMTVTMVMAMDNGELSDGSDEEGDGIQRTATNPPPTTGANMDEAANPGTNRFTGCGQPGCLCNRGRDLLFNVMQLPNGNIGVLTNDPILALMMANPILMSLLAAEGRGGNDLSAAPVSNAGPANLPGGGNKRSEEQ